MDSSLTGYDLRILLLLSGPLAVGKSSFASELCTHFEFERVRTGSFLTVKATSLGRGTTRTNLQEFGDELDNATDFKWVVDVATDAIRGSPTTKRWLFDSVRKERQVQHFRNTFDSRIYHVHLIAPEKILRTRYAERQSTGTDYTGGIDYDKAIEHPNEKAARALNTIADKVIDVTSATWTEMAQDLAALISSREELK